MGPTSVTFSLQNFLPRLLRAKGEEAPLPSHACRVRGVRRIFRSSPARSSVRCIYLDVHHLRRAIMHRWAHDQFPHLCLRRLEADLHADPQLPNAESQVVRCILVRRLGHPPSRRTLQADGHLGKNNNERGRFTLLLVQLESLADKCRMAKQCGRESITFLILQESTLMLPPA